jgi:aminoglycoside phosphotransferase (APT) family kinase protein
MLGNRVGLGRTAEVFAWGDGQILKLFYADFAPEAIERERIIAEALSALQVAAPAYRGMVQLEDRTGLLFERVTGPSMLVVLAHQPWRVFGLARQLAEVHAGIHALAAPSFPLQRAYLKRQIGRATGLSERMRSAALERLAALPDGDRLCHGDFHPDNVVLTTSGPVVLDWMTATRGVPAADVARSLLLLELAAPPPGAGPVLLALVGLLRRTFRMAYWRHYTATRGLRWVDVTQWRLPLLVARLAETTPPTERNRVLRELEREAT